MVYHQLENFISNAKPILESLSFAVQITGNSNNVVYSNKMYQTMVQRSGKEVVSDSSKILIENKVVGNIIIYHDVSEVTRLRKELDKVNQKIRKIESKHTFRDIIGSNPVLMDTIRVAKGASITNATIMLRGESGTGKEIFATAIHNTSPRRHERIIKVNCSAIPEALFESELFGYSEGSFTGAMRGGKKGLFQEAHHGTLFLDEVGDIPPSMQVKLLRVLQEKEVTPIGASNPVKVDVRIICATNKPLEQMVEEGQYREDLYYRLNVFPLFLPPLRERVEDIESIVQYMLNQYNELYNRHVERLEENAVEFLQQQPWKGNVRELENIISRTMIQMSEDDHLLKKSDLILSLGQGTFSREAAMSKNNANSFSGNIKLGDALEMTERNFILNAIEKNHGDKNAAAYELGIPLRTLYYKCNKHNIV